MSRNVDWGSRVKKKPKTSVVVDDRVLVDAAPTAVWTRLEDIPTVAQCLPGLEPGSLERRGPNTFHGRLKHSALGVSANWDLDATVDLDKAGRTLELRLDGWEPKLGLTLNGSATVQTSAEGLGSALDYRAQIDVEGGLAGMGGPIIRSIIADTLQRFVAAVGGQPEARRRGVFARLVDRLRVALRRAS